MKFLSVVLFLCCLSTGSFSQTFTADDGTTVEIEHFNTNTSNIDRTNLFFGVFFDSRPKMMGASMFFPDQAFVKVQAGFGNIGADGNYFFRSWDSQKKQKLMLATKGNTVYRAKLIVPKRVSFGLHGGFDYNYPSRLLAAIAPNDFSTDVQTSFGTIYFGGGVLNSLYIEMESKGGYEKMRGSRLFRLNMDGAYRYIPGNSVYTFEEDISKYGIRFYVDGTQSSWSEKGIFTMNYLLGISTHYNKTLPPIMVIAGFGFGFNF